MKKFIILIILLFSVTACSNGNITKINYSELNKKITNNDTFVILFNDKSQNGELLKQTLETVLKKNNLKAYEINPKKLNNEQKDALRPIISYEDVSILFIKNGKDTSILTHVTSELTRASDIENRLINMGFIKAE